MEPTIKERVQTDRRAVLSALWIFVLFNMLFRDVHEFLRPGAISEFIAQETDEGLLLAAGVVLTLLISMIVVNRVLPSSAARWANVLVSIFAIGSLAANSRNDLDDVWFFAAEVIALLGIIWLAWTWRTDTPESSQASLDSGQD